MKSIQFYVVVQSLPSHMSQQTDSSGLDQSRASQRRKIGTFIYIDADSKCDCVVSMAQHDMRCTAVENKFSYRYNLDSTLSCAE